MPLYLPFHFPSITQTFERHGSRLAHQCGRPLGCRCPLHDPPSSERLLHQPALHRDRCLQRNHVQARRHHPEPAHWCVPYSVIGACVAERA